MSETTLFEKIWESHVVDERPDEPALLYIDLHLVHEVTSPQAFESLRLAGRPVRRPELTIATMDHNVPTELGPIRDPLAKAQLDALAANCAEFGVPLNATGSGSEGIVHVMGPELGLTQPGMTIVCGDSHTSTHGAFGALAFGIGTSEVEHVLATQTLIQSRPKTMRIRFVGELPFGVTAKDMVLGAIGRIGVAGGVGYTIEFAGPAVEALSMEGRMTICNMTIEGGARAGMIAPDDTTFAYIEGRPGAPKGAAWEQALDTWRGLRSDPGATFDREVEIDVAELVPQVTWGTNPGMVAPISSTVPDPASYDDPTERRAVELALGYMGLEPGTPLAEIPIDRVFIGSCTNSRIEDLRAAAAIVSGRQVASSVRAMVVPGSAKVKRQAEDEGLDRVFTSAGFEWREAGCSMCLGMNPDILAAGERCASTSNRNFEGRQGAGGRTHLVSPQMAAAAAITGPLHRREGAGMRELRQVTGRAAVLDRVDVDTDQIIPKQFLKRIERSGYGEFLFFDWMKDPEFELRQPQNEGASILVAGRNFGCGSSREHAAWALEDAGYRVVLAPSFGDIFHTNSIKSGLAPIELSEDDLERVKEALAGENELTVDLEAREISHPDGLRIAFEFDDFARHMLIEGLDDIALDAQARRPDNGVRAGTSGADRHRGAGLANSRSRGSAGHGRYRQHSEHHPFRSEPDRRARWRACRLAAARDRGDGVLRGACHGRRRRRRARRLREHVGL